MPVPYMTREERKADAIAKAMVEALGGIETFDGDPEIIFDTAAMHVLHQPKGVQDALAVLRRHYLEEEEG